MHITEVVYESFKKLKEFKQEVFRVKSYFLVKKQGRKHSINNLKYSKDLILNLEHKNNPAGITFSTFLLTNHNSKGYFKGEAGAITPQGTKTATLNLSPNIFNNKIVFIKINQEPKDINKLKEDSF